MGCACCKTSHISTTTTTAKSIEDESGGGIIFGPTQPDDFPHAITITDSTKNTNNNSINSNSNSSSNKDLLLAGVKSPNVGHPLHIPKHRDSDGASAGITQAGGSTDSTFEGGNSGPNVSVDVPNEHQPQPPQHRPRSPSHVMMVVDVPNDRQSNSSSGSGHHGHIKKLSDTKHQHLCSTCRLTAHVDKLFLCETCAATSVKYIVCETCLLNNDTHPDTHNLVNFTASTASAPPHITPTRHTPEDDNSRRKSDNRTTTNGSPATSSSGLLSSTRRSSHPHGPNVTVTSMCSVCNSSIEGGHLFKCEVCADYVCCESCLLNNDTHPQEHKVSRIPSSLSLNASDTMSKLSGSMRSSYLGASEHNVSRSKVLRGNSSASLPRCIQCSVCDCKISGGEYIQCTLCPDFHICSNCVVLDNVHPEDHPLETSRFGHFSSLPSALIHSYRVLQEDTAARALAIRKSTQEEVVVRKLPTGCRPILQFKTWSEIRNPSLIQILAVETDIEFTYIVTPKVHTTLPILTPAVIIHTSHALISALCSLHDCNLVHGDVSLENVLYSADDVSKVMLDVSLKKPEGTKSEDILSLCNVLCHMAFQSTVVPQFNDLTHEEQALCDFITSTRDRIDTVRVEDLLHHRIFRKPSQKKKSPAPPATVTFENPIVHRSPPLPPIDAHDQEFVFDDGTNKNSGSLEDDEVGSPRLKITPAYADTDIGITVDHDEIDKDSDSDDPSELIMSPGSKSNSPNHGAAMKRPGSPRGRNVLTTYNKQTMITKRSFRSEEEVAAEDEDGNDVDKLLETCTTELILNCVKFTEIPEGVFARTHLHSLQLYNNGLNFVGPQLGVLVNLTTLVLTRNNLASIPDEIGNIVNLQHLNISRNLLTDLPSTFVKLTQLKKLELDDNRMHALPQCLSSLPQLESIMVVENPIMKFPTTLNVFHKINIHVDNRPALTKEWATAPLPNVTIVWNKIYPDEVLWYLYLGSLRTAQSLQVLTDMKIDMIITCGRNLQILEPLPPNIGHVILPVDDVPGENLAQFFVDITETIAECKSGQKRVLVHCFAGLSRSVSCVAAYLMNSYHLRFTPCMEVIRKARPAATPNEGFVKQLKALEVELDHDMFFPKDGEVHPLLLAEQEKTRKINSEV